MITVYIEGPPKAWSAPKVTRNGHSFSPKYQQKMDDQCLVRNEFKSGIITTAVCLEIYFYMPIPKSTSKKGMDAILSGSVLHTKKPDIDNLCKYCIDVIKGIVILDDNQVCELRARKIYSKEPQTVIFISSMIPELKGC